jgi:hypothetical protein
LGDDVPGGARVAVGAGREEIPPPDTPRVDLREDVVDGLAIADPELPERSAAVVEEDLGGDLLGIGVEVADVEVDGSRLRRRPPPSPSA